MCQIAKYLYKYKWISFFLCTFALDFRKKKVLNTLDDSALGLSGQGNTLSPSLQSAILSALNEHGVVSPNYAFDEVVPDEIKQWFPMRIAHGNHGRTMDIRDFLNEHHVENFLPLTWTRQIVNGKSKRFLTPAVSNLIFIRSVEECITWMKRTQSALLPLRYMMWRPIGSAFSTILRVPDRQMANFMRVASVQDDSVMFLGDKDF